MTADPFQLLDMPATFDLDKVRLQQRFLEASAANHPDRFLDPLEQADAMQRSAAINAAYRKLLDPAARAEALLQHQGIPSAALTDATLPPMLLMEVMEWREAWDEAAAEDDQARLADLLADARQRFNAQQQTLEEHFHTEPVQVEAVRQTLSVLRYLRRMLDQAPQDDAEV